MIRSCIKILYSENVFSFCNVLPSMVFGNIGPQCLNNFIVLLYKQYLKYHKLQNETFKITINFLYTKIIPKVTSSCFQFFIFKMHKLMWGEGQNDHLGMAVLHKLCINGIQYSKRFGPLTPLVPRCFCTQLSPKAFRVIINLVQKAEIAYHPLFSRTSLNILVGTMQL